MVVTSATKEVASLADTLQGFVKSGNGIDAAVRGVLDSLESILNDSIGKYKQQSSDLEKANHALSEQNSLLREDHNCLKSAITHATQTLASIQEERSALSTGNILLENQKLSLESQVHEAQSTYDALAAKQSQAEQDIAKLQEDMQSLTAKSSDLSVTVNEHRLERDRLITICQDLYLQHSSFVAARTCLTVELVHVGKQLSEKSTAVHRSNLELAAKKSILQSLSTKAAERQNILNALDVDITTRRCNVDRFRMNLDQLKADFGQEREALMGLRRMNEDIKRIVQEELKVKRNERDELDDLIAEKRDKLAEMQQEHNNVQVQLETDKSENRSIRQAIALQRAAKIDLEEVIVLKKEKAEYLTTQEVDLNTKVFVIGLR
jgi:chromosome segregation ATPase